MLRINCVLMGRLPCWWVYIKKKRNVSYSRKLCELSRHFQPHNAPKTMLNKWKCVAVVSCLQVTNKISIPSYSLQITSFKLNCNCNFLLFIRSLQGLSPPDIELVNKYNIERRKASVRLAPSFGGVPHRNIFTKYKDTR